MGLGDTGQEEPAGPLATWVLGMQDASREAKVSNCKD